MGLVDAILMIAVGLGMYVMFVRCSVSKDVCSA